MHCAQCGREFGRTDRVASIAGSIMGDEHIESLYFCAACGVYTTEVYHDRFLGEDEVSLRGPLSKREGDAQVALIKRCSRPWDKKCRCAAHRAYWGTGLD